jgi:hypothetical protein
MIKKILIATLVLAASFATTPAKFQNSIGNVENYSIRVFKTDDVDLAGKWNLIVQVPGQQLDVTLELTQEEKTFSGTMSSVIGNGKVINGALKEKEFTAVLQANIQGQDMEIQMSGSVDGDKMSGSFLVPNMDAISFTGAKSK